MQRAWKVFAQSLSPAIQNVNPALTERMYFASHSAIAPFHLHEPTLSVEAAGRLECLPEVALLAGGVDLIPALRGGRRADNLVSLAKADDLKAL